MKFNGIFAMPSKTSEGVTVYLRRVTGGLRNTLRRELTAPLGKLRDAQAELDCIEIPKLEDGVTPDNSAKLSATDSATMRKCIDTINLVKSTEIDPVYFKRGFVRVEGLEVDGVEALTVDNFADNVPEELYDEVMAAINREMGLDAAERKNSALPTTSDALEAGANLSGSADPVSVKDSTKDATAQSSSPTS